MLAEAPHLLPTMQRGGGKRVGVGGEDLNKLPKHLKGVSRRQLMMSDSQGGAAESGCLPRGLLWQQRVNRVEWSTHSEVVTGC